MSTDEFDNIAAETEDSVDPWAGDTVAEPPKDDVVDVDTVEDEFDILDGLDLEFEEEESGEKVNDYTSSKTYTDPIDAGLVNGMWVPVRIISPTLKEKHVPRLSSEVCFAKKDGKAYFVYDQVEAMLRQGAEEVVGEVPLPYIVAEANHVAEKFGQRRFNYEIEVPAYTIKTKYFKERRDGKTGYKNESGRSLRVATGVTEKGEKVTKANMHEIADRMDEKIVMAKVTLSQSKTARFRDVLDPATGKPITVLVDPETAEAVTLVKPGSDDVYVYADSGEIWEGNPEILFELPGVDGKYVIRDNSESSDVLKEKYFPWNDYINAPFQPVPERNITVILSDGSEMEGVITWETVGAIALTKVSGAAVDVMLKNGKTITALWFGTEWNELVPDEGKVGGGLDEFAGSEGLKSL